MIFIDFWANQILNNCIQTFKKKKYVYLLKTKVERGRGQRIETSSWISFFFLETLERLEDIHLGFHVEQTYEI